MSSEQRFSDYPEKKIDSSLIQLAQKIRDADTILLTGHTGGWLTNENDKTIEIHPEVLIGGQINKSIVKEQKLITGSDIDTLIDILSIPKPEIDSLKTKCGFDPHQSIFIIKRNKISYIDLWFVCCAVSASDDLRDIRPFGESKWKKLLFFFLREWDSNTNCQKQFFQSYKRLNRDINIQVSSGAFGRNAD